MLTRAEASGTQCITTTQAWDAENCLSMVINTVAGELVPFAITRPHMKPDSRGHAIQSCLQVHVQTSSAGILKCAFHSLIMAGPSAFLMSKPRMVLS